MAAADTSSASTMNASDVLPFDAKSPVWADITPVPQDDGPAPLCPILYSPEYLQAMDLLRALLPANELSPRSLALTEHLSKLCPSSYTVWHYRARILTQGDDDGPLGLGNRQARLQRELSYLDELAKTNMKNYQVWQHRKLIVTALGDPTHELAFVARVLQEDSKNYHTWVYRQWVLAYFGGLPSNGAKGADQPTAATPLNAQDDSGQFPELWYGEIKYVNTLLEQDVRNNSAWNHRYFCLFASQWVQSLDEGDERAERLCSTEHWNSGKTSQECIENEIAYVKDHIKLVPNNASAWNYLRGVSKLRCARAKGNDNATAQAYNPFDVAIDLARSLIASNEASEADASVDEPSNSVPLALEWILDHIDANVVQQVTANQHKHQKETTVKIEPLSTLVAQAEGVVRRLCVADFVRKRYWSYRLCLIRKAVAAKAS